jgi:putative acetyltransferase
MEIRDERPGDVDAIFEVHRLAFGRDQEGRIVNALREHDASVLSLVAVENGMVVGHIMFSPASAGTEVGAALAPMAVVPALQRRGIGSRLVQRGVERLRRSGCPFVVVIGHPALYPRFGFEPAGAHGLTCEWDVPAAAFMVLILDPDIRRSLGGRVRFRPEFSADL